MTKSGDETAVSRWIKILQPNAESQAEREREKQMERKRGVDAVRKIEQNIGNEKYKK